MRICTFLVTDIAPLLVETTLGLRLVRREFYIFITQDGICGKHVK